MPIMFPNNTRETINSIRGAIGRDVIFFTEVESDCPNCTIEPYTGNSTNPFCTVCSGIGHLITISGDTMLGHVTWKPSETLQWVAGGQFADYDCRVQVEYTTFNDNVISGSDYVHVDGKKLKVNQKTYRGVPVLNRIIIDLKEK